MVVGGGACWFFLTSHGVNMCGFTLKLDNSEYIQRVKHTSTHYRSVAQDTQFAGMIERQPRDRQ